MLWVVAERCGLSWAVVDCSGLLRTVVGLLWTVAGCCMAFVVVCCCRLYYVVCCCNMLLMNVAVVVCLYVTACLFVCVFVCVFV